MVFRHLTHPAACRCDGASQRRLEGRAFTVNGYPLVTSKTLWKPENSLKTQKGSLLNILRNAGPGAYTPRHGCHRRAHCDLSVTTLVLQSTRQFCLLAAAAAAPAAPAPAAAVAALQPQLESKLELRVACEALRWHLAHDSACSETRQLK